MEANGTGVQVFQGKLLVNFLNNLYEIFKMRIAAISLIRLEIFLFGSPILLRLR